MAFSYKPAVGASVQTVEIEDAAVTAAKLGAASALGPAILIAASDSSDRDKEAARQSSGLICDGTADQTEINTAILQANTGADGKANGQMILLLAGNYYINGSIVINRAVGLSGVDGQRTQIRLANSVANGTKMIQWAAVPDDEMIALPVIQRMKIYGNASGQSGSDYYGFYQERDDSCIDVRILDIWFDSIKGGAAISLGSHHNHVIRENTFEKLTGTCIEWRPDDDTNQSIVYGPTRVQVRDNMAADIAHFITWNGTPAATDAYIIGWQIHHNTITKVLKRVIDVPGNYCWITDNEIKTEFDANQTYNVFEWDADQVTATNIQPRGLYIRGNHIYQYASNGPKNILEITGTRGAGDEPADIFFQDNQVNCAAAAAGIKSTTTEVLRLMVQNNLWAIASASRVIDFSSVGCEILHVTGNEINSGVVRVSDCTKVVIANNRCGAALAISGLLALDATLANNTGMGDTVSGTVTITNGNTASADTAHGIPIALTQGVTNLEECINLQFAGDPGNAKAAWVSAADYNSFTFTVDADPGADIDIFWTFRWAPGVLTR